MTTSATIDIAGGQVGGAARFASEVHGYLRRSGREDVRVIGSGRRLDPAWLVIREVKAVRRSRRIALNNVGFCTPGGERWTLIANLLHFLTRAECDALSPELWSLVARQIPVVHLAARRSDVLVAPSTTMAERIASSLPEVADRIAVRLHPVSPGPPLTNPVPRRPDRTRILCPVIFQPYKHMPGHLAEWLAAVDEKLDESVRMTVTADASQVPVTLAASPRIDLVGRLALGPLNELWAASYAVFFPSVVESFGFPLAEARVNGQAVIAQDTPLNREIAGPALCAYRAGDPDSLLHATESALEMELAPDPKPFDPDEYLDWMLGKG